MQRKPKDENEPLNLVSYMKPQRQLLETNRKLILIMIGQIIIWGMLSCNKKKSHSVVIFTKTYPGSKSMEIGALIDKKRSGLWTTFDSSGKIESEDTFVDGVNIGEDRMFENGKLTMESKDTIIKNDTISPFHEYDENGNVLVYGQYINRQKKGLWKYYHANGKKLTKIIDHQNGSERIIFRDTSYKGDF